MPKNKTDWMIRCTMVAVLALAFSLGARLIIKEKSHSTEFREKEGKEEEGEAFDAFQWWYAQRAYPNEMIPNRGLLQGYKRYKQIQELKSRQRRTFGVVSSWQSLGPNNIGGRVLSLAVDPLNSNVIWAGSASGGLWKSTTQGVGTSAWTFVNTGFPSLSISTIAIDPLDDSIMYIGTGEISLYHRPLEGTPGARSSYGMGILKSTDAGVTWDTTSLSYQFSALTAIEKIVLNPQNPNTIYAAGSEGTFKSTDAGATWTQSSSVLMAMDVAINPVDTTILYIACGNYDSSPNQGLYESTDAGSTWTQLTNGLPSSDFGRTALAISPTNPQTVYAGIVNGSSAEIWGLYKTTNGGASWTAQSTVNYVGTQGWYNDVVAVSPLSPDTVYTAGIDVYKSTDGGTTLNEQTFWYLGYAPVVLTGGAEGPSNYAHADNHAIVFDPNNPRIMYFGDDGGIFQSTDGGATFAGRNGGFTTTQFYGGFATSGLDSVLALGGLQDNGAVLYNGSTNWEKVYGGDGGYSAIDPTNDNVMFEEYVYLALAKSTDGGISFGSAVSGLNTSNANFVSPFRQSPSNPSVMYAGSMNVYKSTDEGNTWSASNGSGNLNGTPIAVIGVSWTSPETLMAGTGTGALGATPTFQIFSSINGGSSWTNVTDTLPSRYPTDIKFDPTNSSTAYLTYSGYGSGHVYKTTNLGATWTDLSASLPDIPHQSIAINPDLPTELFVGTDLGVYHSTDGGASWEDYNDGLPPTMVLDLVISKPNHALRIATFGHGVYQRPLAETPTLSLLSPVGGETLKKGTLDTIRWSEAFVSSINIDFSPDSGVTWSSVASGVSAAADSYAWFVPNVVTPNGLIRLTDAADSIVRVSPEPFSITTGFDYVSGWNIISVPFTQPDMRAVTIFPSAVSKAFAYKRGYVQTDSLVPVTGYWLKFPDSVDVQFTGDSVTTDSIPVFAGWNLVGCVSWPIAASAIRSSPDSLLKGTIYGYSNGYFAADTLYPAHGYWAKSAGNGTITLSPPAKARRRGKVSKNR